MATFLMTLSVTPAFKAKPHENYLHRLPPWFPLPKRNRFQVVVLSKTTHYGPNKESAQESEWFQAQAVEQQFSEYCHILISAALVPCEILAENAFS